VASPRRVQFFQRGKKRKPSSPARGEFPQHSLGREREGRGSFKLGSYDKGTAFYFLFLNKKRKKKNYLPLTNMLMHKALFLCSAYGEGEIVPV